jgi:hypothetical protein
MRPIKAGNGQFSSGLSTDTAQAEDFADRQSKGSESANNVAYFAQDSAAAGQVWYRVHAVLLERVLASARTQEQVK